MVKVSMPIQEVTQGSNPMKATLCRAMQVQLSFSDVSQHLVTDQTSSCTDRPAPASASAEPHG